MRKQTGFSLLELVVVIAIISLLAAVGLDRYYRLLVDVERATMEHNLGVMRSAVAMQVAAYFVAGSMAELDRLVGGNPMELLAEPPENYLGVRSQDEAVDAEPGNWFFDAQEQVLYYLVRNTVFFEANLNDPVRVGFRILPVYSQKDQGEYISGLSLRPLNSYRWLKTRQ